MTPIPDLLPVEEARARVLARFGPLEPLEVAIGEALGRVVTTTLRAPHALPRFDNSAMDGYALRSEDVAGASAGEPARLTVAGEVSAGHPGDDSVGPGTALRIMTGGQMPPGADAVVPVEDTNDSDDVVEIRSATAPGRHVRPAGDDLAESDVVVEGGTELGAGELALLATFGLTPIAVHRKPRVAVLVTGDELVDPETDPGPGEIRDSNSIALASLCVDAGAEVVSTTRIPDDLAAHRRAFASAAEDADLVVSSGGVAVGKYDYVKTVVEELGTIDLWRVAMQPGKPVVLGTVATVPFLGLPGNPVSIHVGFEQFVRPAIRKMRGCRELLRPRLRARLSRAIEKKPGRTHFVRVRLSEDGGGWLAVPAKAQGSHIQSSLIGCHGVAIFDAGLSRLEEGAEVEVEVWSLPGRSG